MVSMSHCTNCRKRPFCGHLANASVEARVDLGELNVGEFMEFEPGRFTKSDERAANLVRLAKRNSLFDEPLGDIGRERGRRPRCVRDGGS
jgi:hypothetical protein